MKTKLAALVTAYEIILGTLAEHQATHDKPSVTEKTVFEWRTRPELKENL